MLAGLEDLDARARAAHDRQFADCTAEQQDAILTAVVDGPFFEAGRMLVVGGVFTDPVHGGNRNHAGYTLLGMEHAQAYQPPFGWYDAAHAEHAEQAAHAGQAAHAEGGVT